MDKTFICQQCHQNTEHYGLGLCKKCYMRQYRQNPEYKAKRAASERERRKSGKNREMEERRSKSEKRKSWRRKYQQGYYAENRERLIEYQREYRRRNREIVQEADRNRKRISREDRRQFSERDWHNVLTDHDWRCYYCGVDLYNPERDHKIPVTRGGRATVDNIVPCCHSCNCRKNDRTVDEYREFLQSIGETPRF